MLGIGDSLVDYNEALAYQRQVHREVVCGQRENTLLLLEHTSVYTAGKRTEADERPTDGTPVIDVDRGGKITWHGPGQLVGYPITRLSEPLDVVAYVRLLEEIIIRALSRFDIIGERVDGRSGVWVQRGLTHDKIAAIGIRVSEGVTMHGFAINVNNSLEAYRGIIACGIRDAGVTTMASVAHRPLSVSDVVREISELFTEHFKDSYARS